MSFSEAPLSSSSAPAAYLSLPPGMPPLAAAPEALFQDEALSFFRRSSAGEDDEFVPDRLAELLPDLRKRALGLTRNAALADDLVQDTVERALRFRSTFREGSHLRAWLMRIMQNVFISQRRRASTERRVLEGAGSDPNLWPKQQTTELVPGLSPPVERALADLPDRLREAIDLVDLEEYSYRDAAEAQKVPVGTIMSRLHRGRSRLKLILSKEGEMVAA